jgi:outer membrane receptor protein involved in Fe transport
LRAEHTLRKGGYKINYGLNYEYARYFNASNIKNVEDGAVVVNQYKTKLGLNKYGLFAQVSKSYANEKIGLSLGARMDGTNYNSKTANPFTQFSPRFSFSYSPIPGLSFNANTGIYYQLPAYTTLGFQDNDVFVNKINEVKYIRNIQGVFGAAYTTDFNAKVSVEGFYKNTISILCS